MPKLGYKQTEMQKANIGKGNKGKHSSPIWAHKARIGSHHSLQSKKKMRLQKIGVCLTEEHKDNIRKSLIGKNVGSNGGNWKGGITALTQSRLNSFSWQQVRKLAYKRDNYTCKICGRRYCDKNKKGMHAHHIVPYRVSNDDSLDNLITLCSSCHMSEEFKYYKSKTL